MSKEELRNDGNDKKPARTSRLGKEAKIGVTVIILLAIVLGVVVVMRLRGPSPDDKAIAAADRDDGRRKSGHEEKKEMTFRETRSAPFGSTSHTVVPASSSPSGPPKTTISDLDRWKVTSDRGERKRADSAPSPSAPPSFMPDPPKPQPERRQHHERPAADPPTSGYASVEIAPAPELPRYGENPRHSHPSAPAPSSSRLVSRSSDVEPAMPTMSVASRDDGEFRRDRDFSGPRRGGGELRRSSLTSQYRSPPAQRDDGKYEVQPNDSYWTISERLYGTGAYFKALAQQNRGKGDGEDRLKPGDLIMAPTVAELEKSYPDLCPKASRRDALQSQSQSRTMAVSGHSQFRGGRTYTVAEGDTLFNIARYELGKASRWAEIYDLNRDVLGKDFNYLTPGIQLVLPEGDKRDVVAQPPGSLYRR
jgi:nucleoid-associated protein YgaU